VAPEPAAHTVAILPDDAPPADPSFADDALPPLQPAAPPPVPADASGAASASSAGEGFDFEFESASPAAEAAPATGVSESLAESMLLDPNGDSAFDVSSSQLGDLAVTPVPSELTSDEPVAATQLLDTPEPAPPSPETSLGELAVTSPPVAEAVSVTEPPPVAEAVSVPEPPPVAEAVSVPEPPPVPDLDADPVMEAGPIEPGSGFVEEVPTAGPQRGAPADAMAESLGEPLDLPGPNDVTSPDPEPEAPVAAAEPVVTDDALAQIAPALQEQLHETLEKIAWEAFGQVTETVVNQAVERLEKIAWEVVPKLAETLIAEEIRKLKTEE
ncbi:MAG: hypothetical protein ACQGVC_04310, partial [Myxococcota bacterium]